MAHRRAFSLMELLVVLGITALLAALLFASLRGVRQAALRTQTSSTLRALATASIGYAADHNQQSRPGAVSPERVAQLRLRAHNPLDHASRLEVSQPAQAEDAGSYVLRLLPYLESGWSVVLDDYRSGEVTARIANSLATGSFGPGTAAADGIPFSAVPAYGYNATFLGGNDVHGSSELRSANPWTNPVNSPAATRSSDVRRPALLVTFAPSTNWQHAFNPGSAMSPQVNVSGIPLGSAEIRPPRVITEAGGGFEEQWTVDGAAFVQSGTFSAFDGVPYARWSLDDVPTARFDGSVSSVTLTNLALDLRHWFPADLPE